MNPLPEATLLFLLRGNSPRHILLGHKKTGLGAGKVGGIGGKVEPGESVAAAAIREMEEETGVRVAEEDLDYVACLDFVFPYKPSWGQRVHAYLAYRWQGEPSESDEMAPVWVAVEDIPYEQMWQDSIHWLPRVLKGERVRARFVFGPDNETVTEVEFKPWG